MSARPRLSLLFIALSAALAPSAQAQQSDGSDATTLNPAVVTGSRVEADSFDLPYSVDAVDMTEAGKANINVNVSEALGAQPGLMIQNRRRCRCAAALFRCRVRKLSRGDVISPEMNRCVSSPRAGRQRE